MPLKAQAVCFPRANIAQLLEVTYDDPGPEDIVVSIRANGISAGTEGSIFRGIRTHDGTFPLITGYQGAGVVEWVGEAVPKYKLGDRVVVLRKGLSGHLLAPSLNIVWGTHASRVITRPESLLPIPENVPDDHASQIVLFAVGREGAVRARVAEGETVLVVGLGLVGLSFVQCALAVGATVVGLDLSESRVALCQQLGAEAYSDESGVEHWLKQQDLTGFEVAVEATGKAEIVDVALEFVGPGGRLVWQGWYPGRVEFPYQPAHKKGLDFVFPRSSGDWEREMLQWMAEGRFQAGPLISHYFPAEQCQEAYDLAVYSSAECLGIVLEWNTQ